MASLIATGGSLLSSAAGSESARETTLEGAKSQAEIEGLNRDYQTRQFEKEITRQQPYIDTGNLALPEFISAISNKGDVSNLPATQIQGDLISNFLGEQSPDFVKQDALTNLEAVEAEKNKGRLADLVSSGVGGAMTSAGQSVNLGTTVGQSLSSEANIIGQGLQDAAISRQNTIGQTVGGLSGLPAYIAANRGTSLDKEIY